MAMDPAAPVQKERLPGLEQVTADTKTQELIEEFESESRTRALTGGWGRLVTVLCVGLTLLALYYAAAGAQIPFTDIVFVPNIPVFGHNITEVQIYAFVFLGAILALTFILYPARRAWRRSVHPIDIVLALAAVAVSGYVIANFDQAIYRANSPTPTDFVFGVVAILLVAEAARRTVGWHLPALAAVAIGYAYLADFAPGPFHGPPKNLDDIVGNQYLGLEGMMGTPLQAAATYIILFTIYGAILEISGAGKFFIDLSFALTGRRPTAAGRSVMLASFLLGTVAGSGVATTVTLGSISYPMLKRSGYSRESSGAILSAGGIGAVISPPVLGPAAFIMAEILKITYLDIVIMATVPTILYYLGVFLMVEIDSRRQGTRDVVIEVPSPLELLRKYWYHLSSLVAIIFFMAALNMSAITAVFWSILVGIAVSYVRRDTALRPGKLVQALALGTRGVLGVAATTAVAGIVVGILLQTGLGLKISNLIVAASFGNLFLTLVVSAIVLWVLGLSLPITATYLVAVPTVIPALANVGVPLPAAHMFVFYYAVLSEVSPPVALSPFAASAITGGNPYKTMMLTWRYALPTFLVPVMFVQPGGLAMLWLNTPPLEAIVATVSAAAGITALVAGVGGWLIRPAPLPVRIALIAGGLLLLAPGQLADIAGLALFGIALASQIALRQRSATAAA